MKLVFVLLSFFTMQGITAQATGDTPPQQPPPGLSSIEEFLGLQQYSRAAFDTAVKRHGFIFSEIIVGPQAGDTTVVYKYPYVEYAYAQNDVRIEWKTYKRHFKRYYKDSTEPGTVVTAVVLVIADPAKYALLKEQAAPCGCIHFQAERLPDNRTIFKITADSLGNVTID